MLSDLIVGHGMIMSMDFHLILIIWGNLKALPTSPKNEPKH
jgi:hypothetical protein